MKRLKEAEEGRIGADFPQTLEGAAADVQGARYAPLTRDEAVSRLGWEHHFGSLCQFAGRSSSLSLVESQINSLGASHLLSDSVSSRTLNWGN